MVLSLLWMAMLAVGFFFCLLIRKYVSTHNFITLYEKMNTNSNLARKRTPRIGERGKSDALSISTAARCQRRGTIVVPQNSGRYFVPAL